MPPRRPGPELARKHHRVAGIRQALGRLRGAPLWIGACVLALTLCSAAHANPQGKDWSQLTVAQRQALQPLTADWHRLDAPSRDKWLALANRFPNMRADEQARVQERMRDWARTSPEQRGQARLRYQQAQSLSKEERQAKWEAYQSLSPDERAHLADEAKQRGKADKRHTERDGGTPSPRPAGGREKPTLKPVAPAVVQAQPGATTSLISRRPAPAPHVKAGQPKIAASPAEVDSDTLLPHRAPKHGQAKGHDKNRDKSRN